MNTIIGSLQFLLAYGLYALSAVFAIYYIVVANSNEKKLWALLALIVFGVSFWDSLPNKDYVQRYKIEADARDAYNEEQAMIASESAAMQKLCASNDYVCITLSAGANTINNVGKGSRIIFSKADCKYLEYRGGSTSQNACKVNTKNTLNSGSINVERAQGSPNREMVIAISKMPAGNDWINAKSISIVIALLLCIAVLMAGGNAIAVGLIIAISAGLYFLFNNWDLIMGTIILVVCAAFLAWMVYLWICAKFISDSESEHTHESGISVSGRDTYVSRPKPRKPSEPKDEVTSKGVLVNFKSGKSVFRRFRK